MLYETPVPGFSAALFSAILTKMKPVSTAIVVRRIVMGIPRLMQRQLLVHLFVSLLLLLFGFLSR